MAPKIEKIWGSVFSPSAVRRKEPSDKDGSGQKKEQPRDQNSRDERPSADRKSVEKAVSDLRSEESFTHTGMSVEMIESPDGLQVRLIHPSGALIKTMSADDFMRLRESSAGGPLLRGKILDQKF